MYTKSGEWTFNRIFDENNAGTVDFKRWSGYLVDGRNILGRNMPVQDTRFVRFLKRWKRENGRDPGPTDVVYEVTGQALDTVWHMKPVDPKDRRERVGYPTQKPVALYERIIRASSNAGEIILDPFAGCATTLVAAERLGRQWVGMDIWDNAKAVVLARMERERLVLPESDRSDLFTEGIHFTAEPPTRTDDGETAAPFLRVKERVREPEGQRMSRAGI